VAVLVVLFREWRVEPHKKEKETIEQASESIWETSWVVGHQGYMLHEMMGLGR
jgi:hypothetical protein